jgi:hypothetical protein
VRRLSSRGIGVNVRILASSGRAISSHSSLVVPTPSECKQEEPAPTTRPCVLSEVRRGQGPTYRRSNNPKNDAVVESHLGAQNAQRWGFGGNRFVKMVDKAMSKRGNTLELPFPNEELANPEWLLSRSVQPPDSRPRGSLLFGAGLLDFASFFDGFVMSHGIRRRCCAAQYFVRAYGFQTTPLPVL